MLQGGKGEKNFQKQMQVAARKRKEIKACRRGRREKGNFGNKCWAERKRKEIKACRRRRREKGNFKNKCRSLRGRGKR
jgi:hypothetical protein